MIECSACGRELESINAGCISFKDNITKKNISYYYCTAYSRMYLCRKIAKNLYEKHYAQNYCDYFQEEEEKIK